MLFGASPEENIGDSPWARSDVIVMDARSDYFPVCVARGQCAAIGFGNGVELYLKELQRLNSDWHSYQTFEVGVPGGVGFYLAHNIEQMLLQNPRSGISGLVQALRVWRGRIELGHFDWTEFTV